MIRTFALTAASAIALAGAALSANAAPAGQSPFGGAATASTTILSNSHGVCIMSQCPGRSRVVCGCPQGSR